MKFIIPAFLLVSIIIESSLFPFPLTLLAVFIFSVSDIADIGTIAFTSGLVLDFFSQNLLGVSSLYFLFVLFLFERYSKKVQFQNRIFQGIYFIGATIIYSYLFYKSANIIYFLEIVAGATFLFVLKGFFKGMRKEKKLSL